jgi:hypothetical protein
MRIGWNGKYILHCLTCQELIVKSCKFLSLIIVLSLLMVGFPVSTGFVFSGDDSQPDVQTASVVPNVLAPKLDPAVQSIDRLLRGYGVSENQRTRTAQAIVSTAHKYDIDPRLVASIVILESRANPYAISGRESVGVMQVHLPTWSRTVEHEGLNLFKIEDNIELGVRILKGYIVRYGMWEGVMRYKGWNETPESQAEVDQYVLRVRQIYDPTYVPVAGPDELTLAQ